MNCSDTLNAIIGTGIAGRTIAGWLGITEQYFSTCKQNGKDILMKGENQAILERMLRDANNHIALMHLRTYQAEHFPRATEITRELPEVLKNPWLNALVYVPDESLLEAALCVISKDGRNQDLSKSFLRTLRVVAVANTQASAFDEAKARIIRAAKAYCVQNILLRFTLEVSVISELPAGIPALIKVDDGSEADYPLLMVSDLKGDILPVPHLVGQTWLKLLPPVAGLSIHAREKITCEFGKPLASGDSLNSRSYTVECKHAGGQYTELKVSQRGQHEWVVYAESRGLMPGQRLRVIDQGGVTWVDADQSHLPWVDAMPYDEGINPRNYIRHLRFLISNGEQADAQE